MTVPFGIICPASTDCARTVPKIPPSTFSRLTSKPSVLELFGRLVELDARQVGHLDDLGALGDVDRDGVAAVALGACGRVLVEITTPRDGVARTPRSAASFSALRPSSAVASSTRGADDGRDRDRRRSVRTA